MTNVIDHQEIEKKVHTLCKKYSLSSPLVRAAAAQVIVEKVLHEMQVGISVKSEWRVTYS